MDEPHNLDAEQDGPAATVEDGTCGAKTQRGKGPACKRSPSKGAKRCRLHGGASPQVRAKAERDAHQAKLERDIQRALRRFDIQPVGDPLTALQQLAGEILAWKDILSSKVELLRGNWRYSTEYNEQIRGEVLLYERSLDRCVQALATIAKLNIEERLAAVTERQADQLEAALFDAFEIAGIPITDPDKREQVAVAFAENVIRLPQAG